ncbi:MAG: hypothetical protein KF841_15010 [Phycisphaerae bacterium]|nr:hypothetical protein [Phycisphaerae bacterium]
MTLNPESRRQDVPDPNTSPSKRRPEIHLSTNIPEVDGVVAHSDSREARYHAREETLHDDHVQLLRYPIPARPLHLCPHCDYNLTSLRKARCPECGEVFTLVEARRRGARHLPHVRQDTFAVLAYKLTLTCGVALFLLSPIYGFVGPCQMRAGLAAWLVCLSALVAIFATMYRVYFQRTLAEAALIAGILNATIVAIMVIMLA